MGLFRRKTAVDVVPAPAPVPATEPTAALRVGVPGRCPECDGFGYIDHIDMINRFQSQHCRACGHSWEYRFDDDGDVLDITDSALRQREDSDSESLST